MALRVSPAGFERRPLRRDLRHTPAQLPLGGIAIFRFTPFFPADPEYLKINQVNEVLSKLDGKDNVKYLDIGRRFLEADGTLPGSIMPDALHPNEKGYAIWAEAIEPTLEELTK